MISVFERHVFRAIAAAAILTACARQNNRGELASDSTDSTVAAVRQTIARINREFPELARGRNADSAATWFAPDAVVYVNGVPPVRGRDAIRVFYDQFFQAMPIRDMAFVTEEITVRGDLAVETGENSLTLAGPSQATPATVAGKYLAVWKRQPDGRWLLWRHSPSSNVMPTR